MTGDDWSQPPEGVEEIMLPQRSMMSKWTVSPRASPSFPTVGSPAPSDPTVGSPAPAANVPLASPTCTLPPQPGMFPGRSSRLALVPDQPAPFVIVDIGEQHLSRHRDESRIAVETVAVGEGKLRAFDLEMDEIGPGGVKPVQIEAFQQSELLQQHRPLAPEPRLCRR